MTDTIAWISGASSGIGAALAATVPFPDAHIVDISRSGGTVGAEHVPADLSDPGSWSAVGAHFRARLDSFDGSRALFVHSAGMLQPIGFAGEVDDGLYTTNVLLNSAAPQVLGHFFLRAIDESGFDGRADIVMLTSGAAKRPYAGWSSYSAGKAAVDAWVDAAAQEREARGSRVRVVAIGPGVVATPMQETIRNTSVEDFPRKDKFVELFESGGLADPSEAAKTIWGMLDNLPNGAVTDVRHA